MRLPENDKDYSTRISPIKAIITRSIWYAQYCGSSIIKYSGRSSTESTLIGVLFWPLALVDRLFIHKDIEEF
jgi:hypothetical protein